MSRQDERERIQRRLGALTSRVGASRTGIAGAAEAARPLAGRRAHLASALPAAARGSGGIGALTRDRLNEVRLAHARTSVGLVPGADWRSTGPGSDEHLVVPERAGSRVPSEPAVTVADSVDRRSDAALSPLHSERSGSRIHDELSAAAVRGVDERSGDVGSGASQVGSEYTASWVRAQPSEDADRWSGEEGSSALSMSLASQDRVGSSVDGVRNVTRPWGEVDSGGLTHFDRVGSEADVESPVDRQVDAVVSVVRRAPARCAGRWDLAELPSETEAEADDDEDDDFGEVRSPKWLDDPAAGAGWRDRIVPERFRGIRLDPGRRGLCTLLAIGVVAMVVAAVVIFRERPVARPVPPLPAVRTTATPAVARMSSAVPPNTAASPGAVPVPGEPGAAPGTELVVSVVGLVHRTGLVRLPAGSRVADALAAAGGAQDGADLAGLNLAQRLADGDQVLVGPPGPNPGPPQLGSATINAGGRPSAAPSGSAHPTTPSGRVDLNTATESELEALPGIGPVMAKAIIAWRTAHGRFTDVTQLGQVDGIGPTRLSRLRELVKV
ncbi:ComEA family DNA-binding protein [Nocardia sp. CA-128927]|uniref:ComEA family DNA-binding protein n=1 Tax=Nocardia sp. CA-128927 TaxID=3239975 RepID=UPI003D9642FE